MSRIETVEQWLGEDNKIGIDIWKKKYQQNNETFSEWLERVSGGDQDVAKLIEEKKFLFGGRILSNRGMANKGRKITYSNCYVIDPPEDNIESIFITASKLARTFSYGGGCGIDISKLSPRGAKINNSARETTGAVSFMELYNLVTGLIGQNGRRGALMLSLDCNHPDLEEFIDIKTDLDKINKANISVRITNEFMEAVINKEYHNLAFIRDETGEVIETEVDARKIFHKLCENNWNYAEPGMLFWDNIEKNNLLYGNSVFKYAGVNPCAEEPLPAGGSCLLGSINLAEFVIDGVVSLPDLRSTVEIAVSALNVVLDEGLSLHPLEEQKNSVGDWRQIGLGIFGLADMLIKLGIEYGSAESIDLCDTIGTTIINEAIKTSAILARSQGVYPKYDSEYLDDNQFYMNNTTETTRHLVNKFGLRNSQLLTIAPTGSLSTMLGVSGGIEPIFDTHYVRLTESLHGENKSYTVYTPIVKRYMDDYGIQSVKYLPEFFITAKKLDPKKRVDMQSVWQKHIDASISSTINLPEDASVTDVAHLYIYAWKQGLKGLTVFRENCARTGVLTSDKKDISKKKNKHDDLIAWAYAQDINKGDGRRPQLNKKEEQKHYTLLPDGEIEISSDKTEGIKPHTISIDEFATYPKLNTIEPITRKQLGTMLDGTTYVKNNACGKLYITINRDKDGNLVEVFIDPGKSGGCVANAEALGRMASGMMRSGMKIEAIIDSIKGIKCSACTQVKGSKSKDIDGMSCGDILARTIDEEYRRLSNNIVRNDWMDALAKAYENENTSINMHTKNICPECGEPLANEGGCVICKNCGYSKCD